MNAQEIRGDIKPPQPHKKSFIVGIKDLISEKAQFIAPKPPSRPPQAKLDELEERNKIIEMENNRLRQEIQDAKTSLRQKKEAIKKLKEELKTRKEFSLIYK